MRNFDLEVLVSKNNDAIVKNNSKCVVCGHCLDVCKNDITVARMYEMSPDREPICINCGQCANICPTEAIHEKFQYLKVKKLLKNKRGKIVCFSVAPAVRVALGEEFGYPVGTNLEEKIPTLFRSIGADYVFDITFGADLTIMEEAMEFVNRLKSGKRLPQFTSCCPAWVKYAEIFYPEILPNLSTTKSPISMQSSIIKTYFAKEKNIDPDNIINIVIAPCTAKKSEINRKEVSYTNKDTDYVLTTREAALLLKEFDVDFSKIESSSFDSPLGVGSGAGVIFGNSGGVMEASIRTAYFFLTGKNLRKEKLVFDDVRGAAGIKKLSLEIDSKTIKFAVCNGMASAKKLIDKVIKGEDEYHFIEVMNCRGGCIAGGGQPKITLLNMHNTKTSRMDALYKEDSDKEIRLCHKNPEIISIYKNFLEEPNSSISKKLLHTKYFDKSYMLRGDKNE